MSDCIKLNEIKKDLKIILEMKPFDGTKFFDFLKKYNIKYHSDFEDLIRNTCETINVGSGYNIIEVPASCSKTIREACDNLFKSEDDRKECRIKMRPTISGITQSNVSEIKSKCYLSSMNKALLQDNDEKFAIALNLAIANLPDLDCTKFDVQGTSKINMTNLNRCINSSINNQQNIINSCGTVTDVVQNNYSKSIQECIAKIQGESSKPIYEKPSEEKETPTEDIKNNTKKYIIIAVISIVVIVLLIMMIVLLIRRKRKN
jgi:hypothetical protein